jgi:hypothetical protein
MKIRLTTWVSCAVLVAMAMAAPVWGSAPGEDCVSAGWGEKIAGVVSVPEVRDHCSRDGGSGAAGAGDETRAEDWKAGYGAVDVPDENCPDGDDGAYGDDDAIRAAGPWVLRKRPADDQGTPGAPVGSGHARAPPTSLAPLRTEREA